ncbi:rod shape-determining protein MreC [Acidomonas methanolica]|uniref:Cell shape-determining protein MreC n=1 Tax=Acidomonas methanolica NBRC 104435 TaxID=1231351 RepID=A0A023D3A7_ACIMT|nr:rod shape-determining protein MreC [Acidomonas methanolica]MBU2654440.1 rod shape-determining protein MreC [Acidomonas methanolica]TCS28244.1 rod shape-determining protein MreC [Acidomonas methanolica]GAJ28622.1 rod shape-determining protein MreC [Acidomonas methanolica NBRC 104435]GBQ54317.1 rod shape-determining protein MreC [Acidomonas methanolica]GEK98961.1 hypothetical protein AME01nite_14600 [Acidomonas methanolica NBRC 104435]
MLSIQARQALAKLFLPFFFLLASAFLVLGVARRPLVDHVRLEIEDVLAPAYALMAQPGEKLRHVWDDVRAFARLGSENVRLRQENEKLRRWYDVAVALANENAQLKANLHWIPENAPRFVSGHTIRDAGGLYGRAILLAAGAGQDIHVGDVALDAKGLIGRVTEVGSRTSRILLVTDQASRLPVMLESSHGTAIMAGDGSATPRLLFYAQNNHPLEGERVFTSEQLPPAGEAADEFSGLPGGLPVGVVHYVRAGEPVVVPDGDVEHPDIVRVFDYGHTSTQGPEAPGRMKRAPAAGAPFPLVPGRPG